MKILVLNGPNLNLLGSREPEIYGSKTLEEIQKQTQACLDVINLPGAADCKVTWFQSNSESELVEKIQESESKGYDAIVINPAAYTHTSVAILDALKSVKINCIEVHLTNTHQREEFRKNKITTIGCSTVIEGAGGEGYLLAVINILLKKQNKTQEN